MKLVTGSRVPLLSKCMGSAVLGGVQFDESEFHEALVGASRGRALHAFLQAIAGGELTEARYKAALDAVPEAFREDASVIDVLKLPCANPESYASEVPLAWNWVTGEARPTDYTDCNVVEEIAGTLDVVGLTPEAVVVLDYKTGRRFLGRPGLSKQLRTYAMMAAVAYGRTKAVLGFIRIDDEGKAWWSSEVLTAEDLDAVKAELVELMMGLAVAEQTPPHQLELRDGAHCDWCPAKRRCPALLAMATALGNDPGAIVPLGGIELTLEQAGRALNRMASLTLVMKLAESSIREASRVLGPIPLGDGRFKGHQPIATRNITDVDKAVEIVATVVGPDRAAKMVERSVSMGAVEAAAKSYLVDTTGKPRGVGKLTDELSDKLEKGGALTVTKTSQFREFTPKKSLPAGTEEKK